MSQKSFTCIVCPMGCSLFVNVENGVVTTVRGNTCPKGKAYAEAECLHPVRTLTTTVRCSDGTMLPVRTDAPIPKEHIQDAMKIISRKNPPLPISIGSVIIENVYGANVIATANKN